MVNNQSGFCVIAKDIVSLHFETMTITNCQMEKTNVIQQHLEEVEQEHQVKVLLAVESGSRAWGIESENSDWDVRLVYMHRNGISAWNGNATL